jgi:hypothetical protein
MWGFDMKKLLRDTRGNALVGLAFLLPIVLGLSFGILEFSVLIFDFHRANEATRRIARQAAIVAPLVNQATLTKNGSATCSTATGCTGLVALTEVAQSVFPKIGPENVVITYSLTRIGEDLPLGFLRKPLITVRITSLQHDFLLFNGLNGAPKSLTFPPLTTSTLGRWF